MQLPKPHPREAEREQAIEELGLLTDTSSHALDGVVRLLAAAIGVPVCAFSVIYRDRQIFKATIGLDEESAPREVSFCAHVITEKRSLMIVDDATTDARFADNPHVTGEGKVRFYAGAVVRAPNRLPIGALCVVDSELRDFTDEQAQYLLDATQLIEEILRARDLAIRVPGLDVLGMAYHREQFEREWRRAARDGSTMSIMTVKLLTTPGTIDDSLVPMLIRILGNAARRPSDYVCRINNNCYNLVLPGASASDCESIGAVVREQLESWVETAGLPVSVDHILVSAGAASADVVSERPSYLLLQAARDAIRMAPDNGLRVVEAKPPRTSDKTFDA